MHKPIIMGFVVLALAVLPGFVSAQVAAPVLNPTALMATTENPAVLQWNAPSRVSVGLHSGSNASFNSAGVQTFAADLPGWFVQARAVGESLSIGVEHLDIDIKPKGLPTIDYKQTQAALAGQIGDLVAIGVGQDGITQEQPGTTSENTLRLAGASVRLFEHLYLGAAGGTEQISVTGSPASNRAVTRYGIGWHTRSDRNGLHLEVTHEERDEYENSPGVFFDRGKVDSAILEAIVVNVLVGLGSRSENVVHPTSGNGFDEDRRIAVLGWVPASGLAIVLRHETRKREFRNGTKQDNDRDRVAVAWQF